MAKKQRTRQLPRARHARPLVQAAPAPPVETAPAPPAPQPVPPIGWRRTDTWIVVGAVLLALLFYAWRLTTPDRYVFDEVYHGFTAGQIAKGNADAWMWNTPLPPDVPEGVAYEWTHPAMSKVLIQIGIGIFGDDAAGWRAMSALFGALGIGLTYAMGRVLFNRWVGVLAAVLLLLDGLWYVQSRISMNDAFLATFIMAGYFALYFYLRGPADRTRRYLWLAGAALGAAVATKWSAAYSLGLIGLIVLVRELWTAYAAEREGRARLVRFLRAMPVLAGAFVAVPLAIYLAAYTQFFTMGHTFDEWRELQRQMWEYHSGLRASHPWSSRWWTWRMLSVPVWYFVDYRPDGLHIASIYALGNPLIFWAFLPAIGYAVYAWHEARYRSAALAVVLLGFLGQ